MRVPIMLGACLLLTLGGCRCGQPSPDRGGEASIDGGGSPDCGPEPTVDELEPSPMLARQQGFVTSLDYFRDLARRYPRSARALHRAGFAAQHASTPILPEAQRHYRGALELHEQGCDMPEDELWRTFEGLGLTSLMLEQPGEARTWFLRGAERWPDIPQTQYNLACALCLSQDVDGCHDAFVRALEAAGAGHAPAFIDDAGSVDYFLRTSRSDPDLAPLRRDPRYQAAIAPYLTDRAPRDGGVDSDIARPTR